MITEFDIRSLFPRFILNDPTGYAMAKAIEAGLNYFLRVAEEGLAILQDVERMPEWRLDELAWELDCLYDSEASIEAKRDWIRDAYQSSRIHGTPEGIRQYLSGYFDSAVVREWFDAGLLPSHFIINLSGDQTDEKMRIAQAAVKKAKNVRSVLDGVNFIGGSATARLLAGAAVTSETTSAYVTMADEMNDMTVGNIEEMYVRLIERKDVRMLEK